MKVKRFEQNERGRDFVVGDIHGCYSKLFAKLEQIEFNLEADRLFSVGDLVDRGEENMQVVGLLMMPWFNAVMGNHDDMALRWPEGNMQADIYLRNGGSWNIYQTRAMQEMVSEAMAKLPIAIEVETKDGIVGIVHADVHGDHWEPFVNALNGQEGNAAQRNAENVALWSRGRISSENRWGVQGVRAVVVGHTPLDKPVQLGNVYHIDTGAVFGREFTILDLATLEPV